MNILRNMNILRKMMRIGASLGTGEHPIPPAELLWKAVVSRAVRDYFDSRHRLTVEERKEAGAYIENDSDFVHVCHLASLDPASIRKRFASVAYGEVFRLARSSLDATVSFIMGTMSESEFNQRIRRQENGKKQRRDRGPVEA